MIPEKSIPPNGDEVLTFGRVRIPADGWAGADAR